MRGLDGPNHPQNYADAETTDFYAPKVSENYIHYRRGHGAAVVVAKERDRTGGSE